MSYKIKPLYEDIYKHLLKELPKECCGLVVNKDNKLEYIPCKNISDNTDNFILDPLDWIEVEDSGAEILYIVHSHPDTECNPSTTDLNNLEQFGLPWIIMDYNKNVSITYPIDQKVPFEGRIFKYGEMDCYTLIVDYYREVLGVYLEDFERLQENWWIDYGSCYLELAARTGLKQVFEMEPNDILVMSLNSQYPNHYAIYLGNNEILHHANERISCKEKINRLYYSSIRYILRKV